MSNNTEANLLWTSLYYSVFSRRRHEKLWEAMVKLNNHEKFAIDDEAVRIIETFLNERDNKPQEKETSGVEWVEGYEAWRNKL